MQLTLTAIVLALTTADARSVGTFTIPVPDGWTVVDPRNFSEEMLAVLPSPVRRVISTTQYDLFAMDLAGPEAFPVLTVLRLPNRFYVTEGSLKPFADRFTEEAVRRGIPFEILGTRSIDVDGIAVGEIEALLKLEGSPIRELIYVVPGASSTALVTVGVDAAFFPERRDEFIDVAKGIKGMVAPSWLERLRAGVRGHDADDTAFAIGLLVVGLFPVAGVLLVLWRAGRPRELQRRAGGL